MTDDTNHTADTTSQRLAALANAQRRRILRHLVRSPAGASTVDDITAELARSAKDRGSDGDRERIRIRLYHVDLPTLSDAGLVEYDWRNGDVSLTADPDSIATLLEHLKAAEWRSSDFYGSPAQ